MRAPVCSAISGAVAAGPTLLDPREVFSNWRGNLEALLRAKEARSVERAFCERRLYGV
jgi:hypothetical protein